MLKAESKIKGCFKFMKLKMDFNKNQNIRKGKKKQRNGLTELSIMKNNNNRTTKYKICV